MNLPALRLHRHQNGEGTSHVRIPDFHFFLSLTALPANARRIVVLGDSLTSGHGIGAANAFPAVLQGYLDRGGHAYQVINAGVSGDTSAGGVRRYRAAMAGDVRVLVVALGINDGLRGIPVSQVKANLSRILTDARAARVSVLLCAMEALPIYGWDYVTSFRQMYHDLAREHAVPLVPFMLLSLLGNPALMQADHIHPNAAGAQAIAAQVWPHLEPLLPSEPPSQRRTG